MAPLFETTLQLFLGWAYWTNPYIGPDDFGHDVWAKTPAFNDDTPSQGTTGLSAISWGSQRLDVFGIGNDSAVKHKWWDGYQWNPAGSKLEDLGGNVAAAPAAVSANAGLMDIIAINASDGVLQYKYFDGYQWQPAVDAWHSLSEADVLDTTLSPAVTSWAVNRRDIFATGKDGHLYHKFYDGTQWLPAGGKLEDLGGGVVESPVAVSWGVDRLDILVTTSSPSTPHDRTITHTSWNGETWSSHPVPGLLNTTSPPALSSWGPQRLDLLAIDPHGTLLHTHYDYGAWSAVESLNTDTNTDADADTDTTPPRLTGTPAVTTSPNRIDIVALASASAETADNISSAYQHIYWDGTAWSSWSNHGGSFAGPASTVSWARDAGRRLDVFGVTAAGDVGHQAWTGEGWDPEWNAWEMLGRGLGGC